LKKSVKPEWRSGTWPIYPKYEIVDSGGGKSVLARESPEQLKGIEVYEPLSNAWADLFLKFARLADGDDLDKAPLDSDKNARVALEWAHDWGVLGLQPGYIFVFPSIFAPDVVEHHLGAPEVGNLAVREQHNEARGSDSVSRFAYEAWEANVALRLYEAATAEGGPDVEAIRCFIPQEAKGYYDTTPKRAQNWAMSVVKDSVQSKVSGSCYPAVYDGPDGYVQGWGFNSLLGALWLQMMWLITAAPGDVRKCLWCGRVIALKPSEPPPNLGLKKNARGKYKTRRDRQYCDNNGRCKGLYYYYYRVKAGTAGR
jgi:hypothetical protein